MNLNPNIQTRLVHGLAIYVVAISGAFTQARAEMRKWTSSDGRVIAAELLMPRGPSATTVRLRQSNGKVFELDLSRFSRNDQAFVLGEFAKQRYRKDFSRDRTNCYFYSRKLAAKDWKDRTWAYIGSNEERSWLRLAIYSRPGEFRDGNAILVRAGEELLRFEYSEQDIVADGGGFGPRAKRTYEGVDLVITEHSAALYREMSSGRDLRFYVEPSETAARPISLMAEEQEGLREIVLNFPAIAELSTDLTWWATINGVDPETLRAEVADPLRQWRDFAGLPVVPMRPWTNTLGQTMEAEILGFDRSDAVLRWADGSLHSMPIVNFEIEDVGMLANLRLASGLRADWHPIDDSREYYYPLKWHSERRFHKQAILFGIDKESRTPELVIQQVFPGPPDLEPGAIEFRSEHLEGGRLKIGMDEAIKLRTSHGVRAWIPLRPIEVVRLLNARAAESFEIELTSEDIEPVTGQMGADEFRASIEALAIFDMFEQWLELSENTRIPPLEKPEQSEEDGPPESEDGAASGLDPEGIPIASS